MDARRNSFPPTGRRPYSSFGPRRLVGVVCSTSARPLFDFRPPRRAGAGGVARHPLLLAFVCASNLRDVPRVINLSMSMSMPSHAFSPTWACRGTRGFLALVALVEPARHWMGGRRPLRSDHGDSPTSRSSPFEQLRPGSSGYGAEEGHISRSRVCTLCARAGASRNSSSNPERH